MDHTKRVYTFEIEADSGAEAELRGRRRLRLEGESPLNFALIACSPGQRRNLYTVKFRRRAKRY